MRIRAGSEALFRRAERLFPGGVNSPVRAFRAVSGSPFFVARGRGAKLADVDGNTYIDYVMSWGPLILGHAHPKVVTAVQAWASRGLSFGACAELEVLLAERIVRAFPSIEMLRFTSSGTEAAMSAVRLARAATGRKRIIKCDGCYHGHADFFLVQAGSGLATQGLSDSAGVPEEAASLTTVVPFNDAAAVLEALETLEGQVAAIIVEPVAANMGLVPPISGYLEEIRRLATDHGALLIFDEVITGFRLAVGGAQEVFGVRPDVTVLGKIIGGGLPAGAYGASRELMRHVAPLGAMYQAGTLSGNPLAMAAGLATLEALEPPGPYADLEMAGRTLAQGLRAAVERAGVPATVSQLGSLLTVFFRAGPVRSFSEACGSDLKKFAGFHAAMLERGIFLPPSQFEAWFLSTAHRTRDIEETLAAAGESLAAI
jgi:glutamate-1-semialdehyde 2,1-aminomutase